MQEDANIWEFTLRRIEGEIGEYLARRYVSGGTGPVLQRWAAVAEAARVIARELPADRRSNAILHAARTAHILMECGLDSGSLTGALLHQFPKELSATLETILNKYHDWQGLFGEEIDLMARIGEVRESLDSFFPGRNEESSKEMVDRIARIVSVDPRPFLILLGSRLDRLETRERDAWKRSKTELAQETFLLFVPISHFLRMDMLTQRFEDTLFRLAQQEDCERFKGWIGYERADLQQRLSQIASRLYGHIENRARGEGYSLLGFESRAKHLHSAYMSFLERRARGGMSRSMPKTKEELDREKPIDDLLGIRIIVRTQRECDAVRLACHQAFREAGFRPYEYDDRYKYDRGSPYRAIHDRFQVDRRLILEVQIREQKQHWDAEMGPRAHWIYKFRNPPEIFGADRILNVLWEHWFQTLAPLFDSNVFVMTDVGTIVVLKKGSTTLDMAHQLRLIDSHNYNVRATLIRRPNEVWPGRETERDIDATERLFTNQSVRLETVTPILHYPDVKWLGHVARDETRRFLVARLCATQGGQAQVKSWARLELQRQIDNLPPFWRNLGLVNQVETVLLYLVEESHLHETEDAALLALAKGGTEEVARVLVSLQRHYVSQFKALYRTHYDGKLVALSKAIQDDALSNIVTMSQRNQLHAWQGVIGFRQKTETASAAFLGAVFCICCCPLPGDDIVGVRCGGEKQVLLVHRPGCPLYLDVGAGRIELLWGEAAREKGDGFSVGIEIAGFDRPGFAQDVSHVFASEGITIHDYHVIDLNSFALIHETRLAIFDLGMKLASREQLCRVLERLRGIDTVVEAQRTMYPPDYVPVWK